MALLAILPLAAPRLGLGWIYYYGLVAIAALLAYQHWLVRPDDLTRVNIAFFNVNAIVSLGMFVIATLDILTPF
jgi:4-hydroxybenzoate polyprenyltransferase